jgi:3-keto-disaccharide hydrolase
MRRVALLPGLALAALQLPAAGIADETLAASAPADVSAYLGRWDLTLKSPEREYASWLEITRHDGGIRARLVSRWGHARLLPAAELVNGGIRFVSPKEEEGRTDGDMIFEGRLEGKDLVGNTRGPDGTPWGWRGERAPSLERTRAPKWGTPVNLFNGKDLGGWHATDPGTANPWRVEGGTLSSPGRGADLVSDRTFGDFKLHVEFNCAQGANSGVYLRGRYEVQIEDEPAPDARERRLGGIYGFLAPATPADRKPGTWRAYDITLVGRRVTVVLDGVTLIDDQEIPGITGGAIDSHEALPGPIYLQGSEPGRVDFRNIRVTPALGN